MVKISPTMKRFQARRNELLTALKNLDVEISLALSRTMVKCTSNNYGRGCGKSAKIGKLTYIQTHWYVRPSGCSDGDYWNEGEGQFTCPHCQHRNRLYDRPEITKLKHNFRDVKDVY